MILTTNLNGICEIKNIHTKDIREELYLTYGTILKGPISRNGNIIKLGYNEKVTMQTSHHAKELVTKIYNFFNKL